jgi:hypothetical protein
MSGPIASAFCEKNLFQKNYKQDKVKKLKPVVEERLLT